MSNTIDIHAGDAERRALMKAMERNLAAHAAHLHPYVEGTEVFEVGDFQVSDSGLDHDTYNIVSRANFERGFEDEDVREISSYIQRVKRPFSWWVADDAALAEAERALSSVGAEAGETEEVMIADLRSSSQESVPPRGVDIVAVRDGDRLDDYARILAANWNPPAADVARFLHAAGMESRWMHSAARRFLVAYENDEAVAGAEVHIAAGVAGLYGIATLESHRGRGIASALVSAGLAWARAARTDVAVLQATREGSGVYRRHGFGTIGRCTEFAMSHPRTDS